MNQQQDAFLLSTFREEIDSHTVNLTRELVELEDVGATPHQTEKLREIMRLLHTVKGAARMMGFPLITRVAHVMEELVDHYRNQQPPVEIPRNIIDILFEGLDVISETTRAATSATPNQNDDAAVSAELVELLIDKMAVLAGKPELVERHNNGGTNHSTENHNHGHNGNGNGNGHYSNGHSANGDSRDDQAAQMLYRANEIPAFPASGFGPEAAVESRGDRTAEETIRVRLDKLDDLINLAGELVINKQQNEEHLAVLQEMVRQSRHRSRMAQQLREYIIERTPVDERNRLLGITELFSFEKPEMPEWVMQDLKTRQTGGTQTITTYNPIHVENPSRHSDEVFGLDAQGLKKVFTKLEEIIDLDADFERRLSGVLKERKAYNLRFGTAADELRRNMLGIRMLPLDTIFGRFARPVRDLAYERGKEIKLSVTGGTIEVDKRILEQISDPLIHMLRNAVDHGIESTQARLAAGKPLEGTLTLAASQKGSHVIIEVSDDGGGIDPQTLRQAAVTKGYLDQVSAEALTDEAALDMIYRPGFSTRARPDEISGRGIGMDVVQQNIKRLNGRISIQSKLGQGTSFQIEIPLTLATVDALIIRSAGQLFALPSVMVASTLRQPRQNLQTIEGRSVLRLRGQLVPVINLSDVLNMQPLEDASQQNQTGEDVEEFVHGVVLSAGTGAHNGGDTTERYICFEVDSLVDEREVVVKGLGSFLDQTPNIAGVTVLGADGLALILDVFGLIQSVRLGNITPMQPEFSRGIGDVPLVINRRVSKILVVDDSLATRELERSILETAGFKVVTARDGVEALKICRENRPDLVLSDVEMPNMDGFRLSAAIRQDERLNNLPIIIVSSRDSEDDRRRGMAAGAQAYIIKGQFEQNKLLETISRLLVN